MTPHDPALPPACVSARALIDLFLLDELTGESSSALSRHLASCPACAAELGGATVLIRLLGSLPAAAPAPDLDRRIILAALEDRERRHAHRSWLADLRTQIVRGTIRTTGTLMATVVVVALLGATLVFAASTFIGHLPAFSGSATMPTVTPTQSVAPKTSTRPPSPTPGSVVVTPVPVVVTTPAATPQPSPRPTPAATASPTAHCDTHRDPRPVAKRDRGTVAHPHAISNPVADGKATADSSAVGQPVADPNAGAHPGAVPIIAVAARRAGPAAPFRALRKAMEQERTPDRSTRRKEPTDRPEPGSR